MLASLHPRAFLQWLTTLAALASVACSDARSSGVDAGASGDVGTSTTWTRESGAPTHENLLDVWGRSPGEVWAVGWNGTVVHFDGVAWTKETTTSTVPLTAIGGVALPRDFDRTNPPALGPMFAVGWNGTILSRDHATATWKPATVVGTSTDDLFDVFVSSDTNALAVGDGGRIVVFDGTDWRPTTMQIPSEFGGFIEPKGTLEAAWASEAGRYYIAGSGGAAYRASTNTFTCPGMPRVCPPFEMLDTRVSDPLRGLWGTDNRSVYAVGLDSLILHFDGQWRRMRDGDADALPKVFLVDIDGRDETDITAIGWNGTAFRFTRGAWSEEATGVDVDLRAVWVDDFTGVAFAVGASGTILRRDPPVMSSP